MKKILVIQTAFPGDAILTLPMIQKLQEKYPHSKIDVICIPATAEIFNASPNVNNVLVVDKKGKDKSIFSVLNIARGIRKENYSLLISPHRSFRTALIVLLSRIKKSVGFDISSMSWVYEKKVKYDNTIHEVQRNFTLINEETSEWRIKPELNLPKVNSYFTLPSDFRTIAIAPGSVWETKKYPLNYFKTIIEKLVGQKINVVLLGSETDRELCESLNVNSNMHTINLAGKLTILESTAILKQCDLLVSNDSAPAHMGMAADIPVLTIYCSTVPQFGFYPYNSKSTSISFEELDCKPCGIHGYKKCPEGHFKCATNLHPDLVYSKILELIVI